MRLMILALMVLMGGVAWAAGLHDVKSAKVMQKRNVPGIGAQFTLRIPSHIPLKYWVNCDYYDRQRDVIASTRHVLRERVPSWTVKADANDVYFVLCYVPV